MILGIGIDIASVERILNIEKKYGDRFRSRVLSPRELSVIPSRNRGEFIAGRFAVKEAVLKALGTRGIGLTEIEVMNDKNGKPYILNPGALCARAGFANAVLHISITHERTAAAGVAIISGPGGP